MARVRLGHDRLGALSIQALDSTTIGNSENEGQVRSLNERSNLRHALQQKDHERIRISLSPSGQDQSSDAHLLERTTLMWLPTDVLVLSHEDPSLGVRSSKISSSGEPLGRWRVTCLASQVPRVVSASGDTRWHVLVEEENQAARSSVSKARAARTCRTSSS